MLGFHAANILQREAARQSLNSEMSDAINENSGPSTCLARLASEEVQSANPQSSVERSHVEWAES